MLALGVAVQISGEVHSRDPLVAALSRLLRGADATTEPRHRNAHGVACKVGRLAELLDGGSPVGGARLERSVCEEFAGRPMHLAAAVAHAESSLRPPAALDPSRGPVPAFGDVAMVREDGPTSVYLALLHGAVLDDGHVLAKVGRSADVARRMDELNGGLPAPLGLRWRPLSVWRYRDAASAHVAEQAMLARCGAAGCSAGGEFIVVTQDKLAGLSDAGPGLTGRSAPPRSHGERARRGSHPGRSRRRARRRG